MDRSSPMLLCISVTTPLPVRYFFSGTSTDLLTISDGTKQQELMAIHIVHSLNFFPASLIINRGPHTCIYKYKYKYMYICKFPCSSGTAFSAKMNVWVSTCTCTCTLRTVHVLMRDGKQVMHMYMCIAH